MHKPKGQGTNWVKMILFIFHIILQVFKEISFIYFDLICAGINCKLNLPSSSKLITDSIVAGQDS